MDYCINKNSFFYYSSESIISGKYLNLNLNLSMFACDEFNVLVKYGSCFNDNYFINIDKQQKIRNKNIIHIEKGFLFINYDWCFNFCHMMNECIPKILKFIELEQQNKNLKIILCKSNYSITYILEILKLFAIDDKNIYIVNPDTCVCFENLITCENCGALGNNHLFDLKCLFYKKMRNLLFKNIDYNGEKTKIIYIKRNDENMVGKNRFLENENDIILMLQKNYDVKIIEKMSKMTIYEKASSLFNSNIIISCLGANLINLFFTNNPKHVIILHNKFFKTNGHENIINNIEEEKRNFYYIEEELMGNKIITNVNSSYNIDPEKIKKIIDNIIII
jgi:capsular polysaccharide biosynthesis protein